MERVKIREIRIYFESLEQAEFFILPTVRDALDKAGIDIPVKLVRLKTSYQYYCNNLAPIFFWKVPDALITIVDEDEERPLLLIEFSTAVFTKDHELQRFDGMVAAAKNGCFYLKISPHTKESVSAHGGGTDFDYMIPYSLIYSKYQIPFFHLDWESDSSGFVKVQDDAKSCPVRNKHFDQLISYLLVSATSTKDAPSFISVVNGTIIKNPYFKKWIDSITTKPLEDPTILDSNRTRWVSKENALVLKFNRFGHAMDPERGMLAYYGTLCDRTISKMILDRNNAAWYKSTSKETRIRKHLKTSGLKSPYDFLYCFALGINMADFDDFKKVFKQNKAKKGPGLKIDITSFLRTNYLSLNKPLRTIVQYSQAIVVHDVNDNEMVRMVWDPIDEAKLFTGKGSITPIEHGRIDSEDDVTYITVHNVMRANKHDILATSYPGAQGDRVILAEPNTGRGQTRNYVDVISYSPSNKAVNFQENKGVFGLSRVQGDIFEVIKYKNDKDYMKASRKFLSRVLSQKSFSTKVGVGFIANSKFSVSSSLTDLDLDDLDYFVYISKDGNHWSVWSTGAGGNSFTAKKGRVKVPEYYQIVKE